MQTASDTGPGSYGGGRAPHGIPATAQPEHDKIRRAVMRVCLGLLTISATACERESAGQPAKQPPQVGVITVYPQPVARTTVLPGRTAAVMTSEVRPQVTGIILKRLFTEGSEVQEGQSLYEIDPRPFEAQLAQAEADKAKNEASLANAKLNFARDSVLLPSQLAVTQQQYDNQKALVGELVAAVAADAAAVETARLNLNYTKVLAPISGRIGHSNVTPGALVTANQTSELAVVTQLDPIYVDLNQSSTTLLRLRQEAAAGEIETGGDGAAKVILRLEDNRAYSLPGKLQFTEVTVDEGTGTVFLRALFPNPEHLLLPGMYVHAELQEGINRDGILVPQQAVSRNTHGDATVLVVGHGDKAELRVIETGAAVRDQWVVTGGLKPGEQVIIDGLQKVRPGATVRPVAASDRATPRQS